MHRELEQKLADFLGVKHLIYLNNGTIAIQIALKALELKGEVVTTPFSYVATTSSIVWEGLTPVFADIDPNTLCIDPKEVEKKITPNTSAILATHVYGNNCDVEALQAIADKHNLRVIYDGAHAFNAKFKGESLLGYGDAATLSFHATKLYHTIEGGAVVTNDDEIARVCEYMRRFGHGRPDEDFLGVGINGKSSEVHAAMGLCLLPRVEEFIAQRKERCERYDEGLKDLELRFPQKSAELDYNYAYYPVLFPSEDILVKCKAALEAENIFPRRYFRPSLNTLDYVEYSPCPNSEQASDEVMCLPLYPSLPLEDVDRITSIIRKTMES